MDYLKDTKGLKRRFENYKLRMEIFPLDSFEKNVRESILNAAIVLKSKIEKGCGGKPYKKEGTIQTQEFSRCGHCSKYCQDCLEAIKICEEILE